VCSFVDDSNITDSKPNVNRKHHFLVDKSMITQL
jgi:hypothetical protein